MSSLIKVTLLLLISSCAGYAVKNASEKPEPSKRMGPAAVGKKCAASGGAPKIAIIIDDIGKYENDIEPFIALQIPITFSILPGQPFSLEHSAAIKALGYEQMLHLPLEPEDSGKIDDENILTTGMEDSAISRKLTSFFEKFPHISGVNQHMGSKFSQDRKKMRVLLDEVKKRGLYFIDSRTTEKTVAYELALEMGITAASRDVFLDNSRDVNEILVSLGKLLKRAQTAGKAIGIGHPFPETFSALSSFLHEACGAASFVPVSEVLSQHRVQQGQ